jgi:hypothetical protein
MGIQMGKVESAEQIFTTIYKYKLWGTEESISGPGSSLKYTENLRKELPKIIKDHSITKVFDAPCGDFHWMKHVLRDVDVDYIGGDIVRPLVSSLNAKHKNDRTGFIHIDIVKDEYPDADLMICRDCLPHLSFKDTKRFLQNFMASDIQFLLTTTHDNIDGSPNADIAAGGFRLIDLFSSPYCFPADPLARINDWIPPHPKRQMCLWSRQQIAEAARAFK